MEIGVSEAKKIFGKLMNRVQGGEEVVITRHKKRVAKLVPNFTVYDQLAAKAAATRIQSRAHGLKIGFDWEQVRLIETLVAANAVSQIFLVNA